MRKSRQRIRRFWAALLAAVMVFSMAGEWGGSVRAAERAETNVARGIIPTAGWLDGSEMTDGRDAETDSSSASWATDGVYTEFYRYGETKPEGTAAKPSYAQFDLQKVYDISSIRMWRYYEDGREYTPTVIAVSETSDGWADAAVLYNSDAEGVFGFGEGTDAGYAETADGKEFPCADPVTGRYVRVYSMGSNVNSGNHIVEFEVYGSIHTQVPGKASVIFPAGEYEAEPEDGSASPMDFGSSYSFRVNPADGYYVSSVTANGAELQEKDGVYTIKNVQEDQYMDVRLLPYPDIENLALNKKVTVHKASDGSEADKNEERPEQMAADGIIPEGSADSNYCDFGKDTGNPEEEYSAYLQIDMEGHYELAEINLFRYWNDGRTYEGTVIVSAQTQAEFENGSCRVLYNSDRENYHGFGEGTDEPYAETEDGYKIDLRERFPEEKIGARYLRIYMHGSSAGSTNHIVECQVMGYDLGEKPYVADAFDNTGNYIDLPTHYDRYYPDDPNAAPEKHIAGQVTHPDVVKVEEGFGGHKYWMFYTPNVMLTSQFENPYIVYSDDGINWEEPIGDDGDTVNPIAARVTGPTGKDSHNCDTDLVYDSENKRMLAYWNWTNDEGADDCQVRMMVSYDGVHWGAPTGDGQEVAEGEYVTAVRDTETRYNLLSPSVTYDSSRDLYFMYYNNAGDVGYTNGQKNKVQVRWSEDGIHWSEEARDVENFLGRDENGEQLAPWHQDVQYIPSRNEYWALSQCFAGDSPDNSVLYMTRSKDGQHWQQVGNQPVLMPNDAPFWNDFQIYRSTFLYDPETDVMDIWYSALQTTPADRKVADSEGNLTITAGTDDSRIWRIGHASNTMTEVMKALAQDEFYEETEAVWDEVPFDSGSLTYTGSWQNEEVSSVTSEEGASVSLTFYGTGIRWYGQKDTNFAAAEVKIDDELAVPVDTYGAGEEVRRGHVLYERTNLEPDKPHTITITHSGSHNENAASWNEEYAIDIEKMEVLAENVHLGPDDLALPFTEKEVYINSGLQLSAEKVPFNAAGEIVWTSSDETVAAVTEDGYVSAEGEGTAVITAACGEIVKTVTIKVNPFVTEKKPLRMTVNRENPLYVESFYWTLTPEYNGNPQLEEPLALTPVDLWKAVPDSMKQYTVINLIAEQSLENKASVTDWLRKYAQICEDNQIPFSIQVANGETRASRRIPVSFYEEMAQDFEYLRGLNAAELYNSPAFFGDGEEGDHSQYVADIIAACAREGLYWIWTDSNCFGTHGILQDWIEKNEDLSSAMRACKENVIMMYKQTHATIAAEGLDLGLWIADYCDNWGVSSDWWYWGDHKGGLFGAPGTSTSSGNCLFMPEVMFAQDMVRVMSYGGTCFLSEAPFYSNSMGDKRTPAYQYVIIPLFEKIADGEVYIPDKKEVIEKQMTAIVGQKLGDRYDDGYEYAYSINYKQENSQLYPATSKYNLLCSLPANVPEHELEKFAHVFYELPTKEQLDQLYTEEKAEGDAWAEENSGTWYWMNNIENRDERQYSLITPKLNGAESLRIEAGPHTYAVIKEEEEKLEVHLNNYRVDKSELYGTDFPEQKWYPYLYEQNERMENGTLADKEKRETVLTVKNPTEPEVVFLTESPEDVYEEDLHVRPYEASVQLKEGTTDEWEIRILHNGMVELEILTDTDSKPESADKTGLNLVIAMAEKLEAEQAQTGCYTEETWTAVQTALDAARALAENAEASQEDVDNAFLELITAVNLLENAVQRVALETAIEGARAILAEEEALADYTPESVEALREALAEAENVYALEGADQETVNAAARSLMDAVTSLVVIDKDTRLDILIQKAEELLASADQYTAVSVENLQAALEAAQLVADDRNASEEQINAAYSSLAEAMSSLVRKADKSELKTALDKAAEILSDTSKYVEESVAGLQAAADAAQAVYDKEDADTAAVGEAVKSLVNEILKARLMGDVDGDGTVDTADSAKVLEAAAEAQALNEMQSLAADVNRDGAADSGDAAEILQFAAEQKDSF